MPVPGGVSGKARCGVRGEAFELLLRSRSFGRAEGIFGLPCPALAARLGGRQQAALCRPRAGPALLEPLYTSRRHLRSSSCRCRRRSRHLHLEGLPARRERCAHDAVTRRGHAPLSPPRPARRLPAHPPLRLSCQRHSASQTRPAPRVARKSSITVSCPTARGKPNSPASASCCLLLRNSRSCP